ncbi:MAG: hypothetical protein R3E01_34705 [Pirellulaceae bacterium]|nr:hypothetical protein [Planctomycetales bacterium]
MTPNYPPSDDRPDREPPLEASPYEERSTDGPVDAGKSVENPFRDHLDDGGNPYASPTAQETRAGSADPAKRVREVAVLLVIHGALLLLAAAFFVLTLVVFGIQATTPGAASEFPGDPHVWWLMLGYYGIAAIILIIVGGLQIYAGFRNYRLRNRPLGLAALSLGLALIFTCYCAPTGLVLGIYGLTVYLKQSTILAFEQARAT